MLQRQQTQIKTPQKNEKKKNETDGTQRLIPLIKSKLQC